MSTFVQVESAYFIPRAIYIPSIWNFTNSISDPTNWSSIIIENLLIKNSAAMFVVDNTKMRQRGEVPGNQLEFHFDLRLYLFCFLLRAKNNGRSTDNVRPDRGLDWSNSGLAGHFWIQTLYFPYSCRLMLYNAAMISFFFGVFCCFALNPSK